MRQLVKYYGKKYKYKGEIPVVRNDSAQWCGCFCVSGNIYPWMEEPGRLQSIGSQTVGHDWATSLKEFSVILLYVLKYSVSYLKRIDYMENKWFSQFFSAV